MTLNRIITGVLVVAAAGLLWWGFSKEERFGVVSTVSTSDTVQTLRLAVNDLIKLATNFSTTTNNTWTGTQIFSQTSTTTWAGGIQIDGGGFQVSTLTTASCDIKADTSGNFYCGSDSEGTAAWPFTTSASYNGQITQSTSTLLWLRGSALSLAASSSVLTYASSTALTATNLFGGTLVLTNDLAVAQGGTGLSTFGGTNTVLYTTAADTLASEAALTYLASGDLLTMVNGSTTNLTASQSLYTTVGGLTGRVPSTRSLGLTTGTTTTWTATTSAPFIPRVVMPFDGTLQTTECATNEGTLGVGTYINTTHLSYYVASSSAGVHAFSANNTFSRGAVISFRAGATTTSIADTITCTLTATQN